MLLGSALLLGAVSRAELTQQVGWGLVTLTGGRPGDRNSSQQGQLQAAETWAGGQRNAVRAKAERGIYARSETELLPGMLLKAMTAPP